MSNPLPTEAERNKHDLIADSQIMIFESMVLSKGDPFEAISNSMLIMAIMHQWLEQVGHQEAFNTFLNNTMQRDDPDTQYANDTRAALEEHLSKNVSVMGPMIEA